MTIQVLPTFVDLVVSPCLLGKGETRMQSDGETGEKCSSDNVLSHPSHLEESTLRGKWLLCTKEPCVVHLERASQA